AQLGMLGRPGKSARLTVQRSVCMSTLDRFRQYKPPGPVAAAFLSDRRNQVRAILGPQGGGKSVSCIFDLLMNASQMPVCRDGVIRFKVAIIRDTYGR